MRVLHSFDEKMHLQVTVLLSALLRSRFAYELDHTQPVLGALSVLAQ